MCIRDRFNSLQKRALLATVVLMLIGSSLYAKGKLTLSGRIVNSDGKKVKKNGRVVMVHKLDKNGNKIPVSYGLVQLTPKTAYATDYWKELVKEEKPTNEEEKIEIEKNNQEQKIGFQKNKKFILQAFAQNGIKN